MKEKRKKDKNKKHKRKTDEKKRQKKYSSSSSSSSASESDEWVEKSSKSVSSNERDDWMSMTGMLKTYTKNDMKSNKEEKSKNQIDSYNPATSVKELNPYWKNGGKGVPEVSNKSNRAQQFQIPDDDDDYYTRPSSSKNDKSAKSTDVKSFKHSNKHESKSYNWKKYMDTTKSTNVDDTQPQSSSALPSQMYTVEKTETSDNLFMSDEKLNKLAAKVVKAEIMGDNALMEKLKAKLEAAREYRKQNPDAGKDDNSGIMLMSMNNSTGNSRPLKNTAKGDPYSKSAKRKTETHSSGERTKYFGNDDKYNLSQMFEQEKYGTNYNNDAQLAKIASKHKNPNDDLEDIFMDDISKNNDEAREQENEKQRAIKQHVKLERSIEGCEFCLDSKNMLKHLMVSCGNKVYIALPNRQSLVKGQCIITTIQHNTCVTMLDEDVWEEILGYRKALTQFFNSQDMDVVFFETATKLHKFPHMVINCVPLPRDVGDMAAIYFKKALLECETEWSMNKKVVDLKGKNIRKGIPKGLPYFWVDFGMDPGFAHVIEDQQLFPRIFGEEIIGGMLDLEHHLWKNPRKEYGDTQRKKVLEFVKEWKQFEPEKN